MSHDPETTPRPGILSVDLPVPGGLVLNPPRAGKTLNPLDPGPRYTGDPAQSTRAAEGDSK